MIVKKAEELSKVRQRNAVSLTGDGDNFIFIVFYLMHPVKMSMDVNPRKCQFLVFMNLMFPFQTLHTNQLPDVPPFLL